MAIDQGSFSVGNLMHGVCVSFVLSSVTLLSTSGFSPAQAQPVTQTSVLYGHADGVDLRLDIARPTGDGPFPAIVFIHGGGWYLGGRQTYSSQIEEAARRGFVGVTISYRMMSFDEKQKETTTATTRFPAQVHDVKAAVRWLRANAETFHIDPQRIGATGRSAGGHLSLMLGLTDESAGLEGDGGHPDRSSRVQAVVNVCGPTHLPGCYEASSVAWIFRLFTGGTPEEAAETHAAASPVTYVSQDDPPVLSIHGTEDRLVPIAQARLLDERINAAGASHTLVEFDSQGHGFDAPHRQRELDLMWDFFSEHLR